jgi:hypothetical protein
MSVNPCEDLRRLRSICIVKCRALTLRKASRLLAVKGARRYRERFVVSDDSYLLEKWISHDFSFDNVWVEFPRSSTTDDRA